ncbi:hypothetical protein Goshw_005083 [Gossypium schwendimanii]|uniref:Uncharacterized protein n=1 Tax=Gossypium schwendimanii TaxID=34291 RepID=A0A7J9MRG2_GOSSC|nr:hypothetical protein [Gossypium schwendimanii]
MLLAVICSALGYPTYTVGTITGTLGCVLPGPLVLGKVLLML